jgi:glycosyltransferase involved in cell wall biosynthesis
MNAPLVSVICLCYNQAQFVGEAVRSALNQTHPNIQLIIVDDASTDNSKEVIQKLVSLNPQIQSLLLTGNLGNCKAFNQGLALAKGDFIIDLAADDVLLPERIETGVKVLLEKGNSYGVHFSDAELIDEAGKHLSFHSEKFPHNTIPQGDIYPEIISRYFICPPTVMCTRHVMTVLDGYDETLSYEDFDFWIRSSRAFKYVYSPEVLVKRRVSKNALSSKQFNLFNAYSKSTYRVCEKIFRLNNTAEERQALRKRILYEIRLNLRLLNFGSVLKFFSLLIRNNMK